MLTYSQKKYLFAIYKLSQNGKKIRSAEVAKVVGVSKPSTVKALEKLSKYGYIIKEPYFTISITDMGIKEANELYTPSIIIKDFLQNIVGISEKNADADTVSIVSHISAEGLEKLVKFALR